MILILYLYDFHLYFASYFLRLLLLLLISFSSSLSSPSFLSPSSPAFVHNFFLSFSLQQQDRCSMHFPLVLLCSWNAFQLWNFETLELIKKEKFPSGILKMEMHGSNLFVSMVDE